MHRFGIGTGNQKEIRVKLGLGQGFNFSALLIDGLHGRIGWQLAALFGKYLVLQVDTRNTSSFELAQSTHRVEDATVTGVGIAN